MDWPQFLIAFLCNVATLTFGLQAGWLSPLQPALQSDNSPLGPDVKPLTDEQISWIGSLPSIIGVLAPPIFGWTLDRFGRKFTMLLTTLPNLLSYLLLIFANNVEIVYVARLIGGFCACGGFICCSIYINETVMPKWKGTLGSLTGFFVKLGIIISFILGSYTSYLFLNLISASFTVFFLFFSIWLPESPVYLMKQGKWLEAESALVKLWGEEEKGKISEEIQFIQMKMCDEVPRNKWAIFKQFFTKRQLRLPLMITCGVVSIQCFCGYPAVVRYSVDIFDKTGITYSPHLASVFLAITQLVFSFVGALILDRTGRKRMIVLCLTCMFSCMGILSVYLHLKTDFPDYVFLDSLKLLPTIALVGFMAFYSAGFGTVPFVLIPELFSADTRATASTICNLFYAVCEFIVLKLFPTLTNVIELSGSLAIFAVFGSAGVLFLSLVMIETKGLDFDEIQRKLKGDGSEATVEPNDTLIPLTEKIKS